jgi:hypothetical protein
VPGTRLLWHQSDHNYDLERVGELHTRCFRKGSTVTVRLEGTADLITDQKLRKVLDFGLSQAGKRLVVDVSGVTNCDVWGLDALMRTKQRAADRGIAFSLPGAAGLLTRLWRENHYPEARLLRHAAIDVFRRVGEFLKFPQRRQPQRSPRSA